SAARLMERRLADLPGVWIEQKGASLSVHFRGISAARERRLRSRLLRLRRELPEGFHWRVGKCTWNLLPTRRWNKGEAASFLWRRMRRPFLLAIGDDEVDERMFLAAE